MPDETYSRGQMAGLFVGPVVAIGMLVLPAPAGLSVDGWSVAAVALLMGIWWMTEAVPLAVTALLPMVLFPPLGQASLAEMAPAYANPLIFLFLGGFMMARAMVGQNLSQRIALNLLSRGALTLSGVIGSLMVATAFLSMWVSNTATTMMMLPIGQSIIGAVQARANDAEKPAVAQFSTAMMLGIAYSATIGGMGTLIGTPPNALFAAYMLEAYGVEVEFWRWMMIGVPTVLILLPIAWFLVTKVSFFFEVDRDLVHGSFIETESKKLGPHERGRVDGVDRDQWRGLPVGVSRCGGWLPSRPSAERRGYCAHGGDAPVRVAQLENQGRTAAHLGRRGADSVGHSSAIRRRPGAGECHQPQRSGGVDWQCDDRLVVQCRRSCSWWESSR